MFNYIFYKYFVDASESYSLATITVTITMTIGLLCILLIPLDIFLINYKGITIIQDREILQNVFYCKIFWIIKALYGSLLFLSFFLIPFTYFYGEERLDDIEPTENNMKEKICNSLKYTVWIILLKYE